MPKPKVKEPPASLEDPAADAPETSGSGALTADEQELLGKVLKFLVNISRVPHIGAARREGYTSKEHKEGWRLFKLASGEGRPLEHLFEESAAGTAAAASAERLRILQDIDAFENTWFPRTRAIIRRAVPRARRDAFEAAFFKNLEQQPLGPGVIGSVGTYLSRLEDLAKTGDADAKKVRETLLDRGLTDAKISDIRALLGKLEGAGGSKKAGKVSPADLAKAQADQREALEDLRAWFNDWGTTLRSVFNTRAQITLGLTALKRTRKGDEDEASEEEPEAEEEPTKS
jgi:hypothetical protein